MIVVPAGIVNSSVARATRWRSRVFIAENNGTLARWSRYARLPAMSADHRSARCVNPRMLIKVPSPSRNKCEKERPYGGAVDVVLVRWPFEGERRARLARDGIPRLL